VGVMNPLGICRILRTNMLNSPLYTCDTLPHPCVVSVETSWLEMIHFENCKYKEDVLSNVIKSICT
jgi:hypothetical protein